MPKGVAQPWELTKAIARTEGKLRPDVVHIRHTITSDWSGEAAVFFRILLSDEASTGARLRATTNRVKHRILEDVDPTEKWGLIPYFSFRSVSEQNQLQEPAWA